MDSYHKLKNKRFGTCRVLKKIGPNTYRLELPKGMGISPILNISDLSPYHGEPSRPQPSLNDHGIPSSSHSSDIVDVLDM